MKRLRPGPIPALPFILLIPAVSFGTVSSTGHRSAPAGTPEDKGSVLLYQRFLDFTGGYVQHCHILGHEDRGMMLNVQTVCPNGMFGKPTPDRRPECRMGNYLPALPGCEAP